jgi:hypothetical protein
MADIGIMVSSELDRTGDNPLQTLKSVVAAVEAGQEVYELDVLPLEWLSDGRGQRWPCGPTCLPEAGASGEPA